MTDQITLEEALKLVKFIQTDARGWQVLYIYGAVVGTVCGGIGGNIKGTVNGNIYGNVNGTINGCEWQFVETPKEKLQQLLDGASEEELLKNQATKN